MAAMRLLLFLLAATSCLAATPDREGARKLLEKSVELAGAARLEVHVMTMMHAGRAYAPFDKPTAVAWLRQAFAASAGLEGDLRDTLQSAIVKSLAAVSLEDAASVMRGMAEPARTTDAGDAAADAIIGKLIEAKQHDRAMEVLALVPESAEYPFSAARVLFESLPEGDSRRAIVFGRAAEAYGRRPVGPFPDMLARHWRDVPQPMAQSALGLVINALRSLDEETRSAESYATDKGDVKLGSRQTVEFFRIIGALRALDAKRCDELLASYPDLRAAVEKYPDGRLAVEAQETMRSTQGRNSSSLSSNASLPGEEDDDPSRMLWSPIFSVVDRIAEVVNTKNPAGMKEHMAGSRTAQQVFRLGGKDPGNALSQAESLPAPARAETLARIAETMAEKDPEGARRAVTRAESVVEDIKGPSHRTFGWMAIARARHKLKDEKLAWTALERAQEGVVDYLRGDISPEHTNRAPREYWPSTQSGRLVAGCAAFLFGAKADALLETVTDTDLALLQRVQIAETLLDYFPNSFSVLVRYSDPE
jgi:hypothetical protein